MLSNIRPWLTFFNDAGFSLQQRGTIREGYAADLLLFDPQTVARGPKHRVFDLRAEQAA